LNTECRKLFASNRQGSEHRSARSCASALACAWIVRLIVLASVSLGASSTAVRAQTTLGTVTYQDWTGASAPEQNLRFSHLDSGASIPSGLKYTANRVLSAAGVEVPWQAMSNGDLMVRTSVPASLMPLSSASLTRAGNALYTVNASACAFSTNSAVKVVPFSTGSLPAPLSSGTVYFIQGCSVNGGLTNYYLSNSYNGPQIALTTSGSSGGFYLEYVPFAVSGSTFTSAGHGYHSGDTVEFTATDSGTLPDGLNPNTLYFVCNATTDTFQVSSTSNCQSIVIVTSSGTALPAIISTKVWTLQSGTETTVHQTNGPQAVVRGSNWEITNELTGIRIPSQQSESAGSYKLAPIQGLQLADGSWTPMVGNMQYDASGAHGDTFSTAGSTTPVGYSVIFTEQGLLEISLQASLSISRARQWSPTFTPTYNAATGTFSGHFTGMMYALYVTSSTIAGLSPGMVVYAVNGVNSTSFQVSASPATYSYGQFAGTPMALGSSGSATFEGLYQEPDTGNPPKGFYTLTATLDANSKAVQILEDHNVYNYTYNLNIRPNLVADTARFRTTALNPLNTGFTCGYVQMPITSLSLSGNTLTIVAPNHGVTGANPQVQLGSTVGIANANNQTFTATLVDANTLAVNCPNCSGSTGSGGFLRTLNSSYLPETDETIDLLGANRNSSWQCTSTSLRPVGSQYPPNDQQQTGYYWMLYNSHGGPGSNAVGFFLGKGSQQYMGEYAAHGPGVYDTPTTSSQGFSLYANSVAPTQYFYTGEAKKPFGFWVSTNTDILPPYVMQPIGTVRSTLVGINLNKVNSYTLTFPDPPGGWPYLYLSDAGMNQLQALLTNGTSVCGSPNCLYNAIQSDGNQQPLAQMLMDNTPPRVAYNTSSLLKQTRTFANDFFNQTGNLDFFLLGYQGAYPCPRNQALANLILKSPAATPWEKARVKGFLAYCACFIWDPDFQSQDPSSSFGLANQQSQFLQEQSQLAAQIYTHPLMAALYPQAIQNIQNNLLGSISQYGSGYASWHYQGAATELGLFGWLSLVNNGSASVSQFPKIAQFGSWYLSGITPPEVRFGTKRMYISDGDGNTEPEADPGLLATLLANSSPTLASNLEYIWQSQGLSSSTISSFFAPSLLADNFAIAPVDPQLTSEHIAGYHSMLRSGWDTPYENAVDFLYGGYYSAQGHAHQDTGRVATYLLGAPVSIDWNPNLYYPEVSGRFQHSTVCLDSELSPNTWNQDNPPLTACTSGWTSTFAPDVTNLIETSTFTGSSSAAASWTKPIDGTTFQRSVTLLNYDPGFAVVHVYDMFTGAQAGGAKTLTWNLMAANGPVATPAGSYTPTVRQNLGNNGVMPSNGPVDSLTGNGLQQFAFTGAPWANHVTDGVDFDLYTRNADQDQFLIGNWCHNQYQNNCLLESQDILRLHGSGNFDTWIIARPKGTPDPSVSIQSCGIQVALTGTLCFDQTYSRYDDGKGTQTLATYDASSHLAFGMTISGAPAECVLKATSVACTVQAWSPGVATITLPAGFYPQQPTTYDKSGNVIAYSENGLQTQLLFGKTAQALRQISLTAPQSGSYSRLKFAPAVDSTTSYLTRVPAGAIVSVQAPTGTYQAQWVTDSAQSQIFNVVVR